MPVISLGQESQAAACSDPKMDGSKSARVCDSSAVVGTLAVEHREEKGDGDTVLLSREPTV